MDRSRFNAVASTPLPIDVLIDIIIEIDNMPKSARPANGFQEASVAQHGGEA